MKQKNKKKPNNNIGTICDIPGQAEHIDCIPFAYQKCTLHGDTFEKCVEMVMNAKRSSEQLIHAKYRFCMVTMLHCLPIAFCMEFKILAVEEQIKGYEQKIKVRYW